MPSIPAQVGSYFLGLDAGPVFEFGEGAPDIGGRVRVFASLGFVALYVGEWYRPRAAQASWSTEIGLLLKIPTLNYQKRQGWTFDLK